jgi:hypothetical protein
VFAAGGRVTRARSTKPLHGHHRDSMRPSNTLLAKVSVFLHAVTNSVS